MDSRSSCSEIRIVLDKRTLEIAKLPLKMSYPSSIIHIALVFLTCMYVPQWLNFAYLLHNVPSPFLLFCSLQSLKEAGSINHVILLKKESIFIDYGEIMI